MPLAENLTVKLTGAQLYRDGFITSKTTGRKFGDIDDRLFRGDLLWTPSDDVTFRFVAESTDLDRNGSARTLEEIRLTNPRPLAYNSAGYPFTNLTARVGVRRRAPSANGRRCRTSRTTATCRICCA